MVTRWPNVIGGGMGNPISEVTGSSSTVEAGGAVRASATATPRVALITMTSTPASRANAHGGRVTAGRVYPLGLCAMRAGSVRSRWK
jgi:hypothetical protein